MIRTSGIQTTTNIVSPLFQDTLQAAIVAQPQNAQNFQALTQVYPTNFEFYMVGDYVMLSPGTANQERCLVAQIISPYLYVQGCVNAHADTDLIALDILCSSVIVQASSGQTGAMFIYTYNQNNIGTPVYQIDPTVNSQAAAPFVYTSYAPFNNLSLGDVWLGGNGSDTFIAIAFVA